MWSQGRRLSGEVIVKVANSGTKGNRSGAIYQPPYPLPDGTSCFRFFICQGTELQQWGSLRELPWEELAWVSLRGYGDQGALVRGTGLRAGAVHNSGRKLAGYILVLPTTFSQAPKLFQAIYKTNKIKYMKMNCKLLYHFWSKGWWWLRGWCFPFFVYGSQGSFYRRGWKDGLFFSSSNEKSPWPPLQGHDKTRLEMTQARVLCASTDSQRGSID